MHNTKIINTAEIFPAGIPCTYLTPNFLEKPYGTIFLYHGWSNDTYKKEGFLFFASLLAQQGYQVFVPELINHGERGTLEYWDANVIREHIWETCIQSIREFDVIVAELSNTYKIDPARIALVGHSLGGCISSSLFSKNKFIKCLVTMNSSSALEDLDRNYFSKLRKVGGSDEFLTEDEYGLLKHYDTMNSLDQLNPRPMLLLHGDSDTTIPISAQKYFYNNILPLYEDNPDNLKFVEIENVNHTITLDIIKNTIEWLNKNMN